MHNRIIHIQDRTKEQFYLAMNYIFSQDDYGKVVIATHYHYDPNNGELILYSLDPSPIVNRYLPYKLNKGNVANFCWEFLQQDEIKVNDLDGPDGTIEDDGGFRIKNNTSSWKEICRIARVASWYPK